MPKSIIDKNAAIRAQLNSLKGKTNAASFTLIKSLNLGLFDEDKLTKPQLKAMLTEVNEKGDTLLMTLMAQASIDDILSLIQTLDKTTQIEILKKTNKTGQTILEMAVHDDVHFTKIMALIGLLDTKDKSLFCALNPGVLFTLKQSRKESSPVFKLLFNQIELLPYGTQRVIFNKCYNKNNNSQCSNNISNLFNASNIRAQLFLLSGFETEVIFTQLQNILKNTNALAKDTPIDEVYALKYAWEEICDSINKNETLKNNFINLNPADKVILSRLPKDSTIKSVADIADSVSDLPTLKTLPRVVQANIVLNKQDLMRMDGMIEHIQTFDKQDQEEILKKILMERQTSHSELVNQLMPVIRTLDIDTQYSILNPFQQKFPDAWNALKGEAPDPVEVYKKEQYDKGVQALHLIEIKNAALKLISSSLTYETANDLLTFAILSLALKEQNLEALTALIDIKAAVDSTPDRLIRFLCAELIEAKKENNRSLSDLILKKLNNLSFNIFPLSHDIETLLVNTHICNSSRFIQNNLVISNLNPNNAKNLLKHWTPDTLRESNLLFSSIAFNLIKTIESDSESIETTVFRHQLISIISRYKDTTDDQKSALHALWNHVITTAPPLPHKWQSCLNELKADMASLRKQDMAKALESKPVEVAVVDEFVAEVPPMVEVLEAPNNDASLKTMLTLLHSEQTADAEKLEELLYNEAFWIALFKAAENTPEVLNGFVHVLLLLPEDMARRQISFLGEYQADLNECSYLERHPYKQSLMTQLMDLSSLDQGTNIQTLYNLVLFLTPAEREEVLQENAFLKTSIMKYIDARQSQEVVSEEESLFITALKDEKAIHEQLEMIKKYDDSKRGLSLSTKKPSEYTLMSSLKAGLFDSPNSISTAQLATLLMEDKFFMVMMCAKQPKVQTAFLTLLQRLDRVSQTSILNQVDEHGQTAIMWAVTQADDSIFKTLVSIIAPLDDGYDIFTKESSTNYTALKFCLYYMPFRDTSEKISCLLKAIPDDRLLDASDRLLDETKNIWTRHPKNYFALFSAISRVSGDGKASTREAIAKLLSSKVLDINPILELNEPDSKVILEVMKSMDVDVQAKAFDSLTKGYGNSNRRRELAQNQNYNLLALASQVMTFKAKSEASTEEKDHANYAEALALYKVLSKQLQTSSLETLDSAELTAMKMERTIALAQADSHFKHASTMKTLIETITHTTTTDALSSAVEKIEQDEQAREKAQLNQQVFDAFKAENSWMKDYLPSWFEEAPLSVEALMQMYKETGRSVLLELYLNQKDKMNALVPLLNTLDETQKNQVLASCRDHLSPVEQGLFDKIFFVASAPPLSVVETWTLDDEEFLNELEALNKPVEKPSFIQQVRGAFAQTGTRMPPLAVNPLPDLTTLKAPINNFQENALLQAMFYEGRKVKPLLERIKTLRSVEQHEIFTPIIGYVESMSAHERRNHPYLKPAYDYILTQMFNVQNNALMSALRNPAGKEGVIASYLSAIKTVSPAIQSSILRQIKWSRSALGALQGMMKANPTLKRDFYLMELAAKAGDFEIQKNGWWLSSVQRTCYEEAVAEVKALHRQLQTCEDPRKWVSVMNEGTRKIVAINEKLKRASWFSSSYLDLSSVTGGSLLAALTAIPPAPKVILTRAPRLAEINTAQVQKEFHDSIQGMVDSPLKTHTHKFLTNPVNLMSTLNTSSDTSLLFELSPDVRSRGIAFLNTLSEKDQAVVYLGTNKIGSNLLMQAIQTHQPIDWLLFDAGIHPHFKTSWLLGTNKLGHTPLTLAIQTKSEALPHLLNAIGRLDASVRQQACKNQANLLDALTLPSVSVNPRAKAQLLLLELERLLPGCAAHRRLNDDLRVYETMDASRTNVLVHQSTWLRELHALQKEIKAREPQRYGDFFRSKKEETPLQRWLNQAFAHVNGLDAPAVVPKHR